MGFNIAQAVNYGTDRWLDKLSKFRGCKCEKKVGVEIESYDEIVKNLTKSNKRFIQALFTKRSKTRHHLKKYNKRPHSK